MPFEIHGALSTEDAEQFLDDVKRDILDALRHEIVNGGVGITPHEMLSEKDAAKYLGLSAIALRAQRCNGPQRNHIPFIPYVKIGRAIRYMRQDLDSIIQKNRVTSNVS